MARTLIVGDVHGCSAELAALLKETGLDEHDHLVLVGDLVAKGPDSAGVIRLARTWSAKAVRGNHDAHLLKARAKLASGEWTKRAALCSSLNDDDWAYLDALPAQLRLNLQPTYGGQTRPFVRVVHGGFDPDRAADEQHDPELLMNTRSVTDGTVSAGLDGEPWASLWPGPELVVFGHDAVRGLQQHPHALGLDTGCCYGGRLTGALIEGTELSLVSVPAFETYSPIR